MARHPKASVGEDGRERRGGELLKKRGQGWDLERGRRQKRQPRTEQLGEEGSMALFSMSRGEKRMMMMMKLINYNNYYYRF